MANAAQIQERLQAAIGDRYDVVAPIGAGGMATVFLARHRVHGGFCAVKVLAEHLALQEPLVRSFLTEAQAAAALDAHPNIVGIVDIAEHAGLYYMVMKYVEGEDLSSYLARKGRLDWRQAAYVTAEIAAALSYAHDRGVIHRDLKPSNIRLGAHGRVIVLDFGIAKIGQTPSSFTQMGARAGTPHYMAPEQISGKAVDHRSDLYSLGVILYELATGRRPFEGETSEAVWFSHVSATPPHPQQVDPSVPDPLCHIILKLLEKDPDERYDTAARVTKHLRMLGLEDAAESLDPQDRLDFADLRSRAGTPTPLGGSGAYRFGERTPTMAGPRTGLTTPGTAAAPHLPPPSQVSQAAPAKSSNGVRVVVLLAVVFVLVAAAALAGFLLLGRGGDPAPAEAQPPPAVEELAPAQAAESETEMEPAEAPPSPVRSAEPAEPSPEELDARRRAEEQMRRRRQDEARRKAEVDRALRELRGEGAAQGEPKP